MLICNNLAFVDQRAAAMGSNFEPVSAIVVGAGFAGLATAIELSRRGNHVWVFESVKTLTNAGTKDRFSVSLEHKLFQKV